MSGCNNLTGTTGTAGATSAAEAFSFLVVQSSSSGMKRKRTAPPSTAPDQALSQESIAGTSTATEEQQGEEEEPGLTFQLPEKDDSPDITIKRHEELKHGPEQYFCGKADLKTQEDKDKHFKKAHFQKGRGINPKPGKKKDL